MYDRAVALSRGRPGVRVLATITRPDAEGVFWSALERAFGRGVAHSGLPKPLYNAPLRAGASTLYADALWKRQRVVVELHGLRFHRRPADRQRDDERLNLFTELGYRMLAFAWRQVHDEFPALAGRLHRVLTAVTN